MTTAPISVQRTGNVLDLNAYRQQREEALALPRTAEEDAWAAWCEQTDPAAFPAPVSPERRRKPRLGEVMDVAASAAMILAALTMSAMVLL